MGLLHIPLWLDFQKRYFSGTIVWTTKLIPLSTSSTEVLVRRTIGSTAIRSLFLTQSRVSIFRNFLRTSGPAESRSVRIRTRLLFAPSRSMNQLAQLHFILLPRWTTSGRATRSESSIGNVPSSAIECRFDNAFLLHSSQSVITVAARNLLHFSPFSKHRLQALKEGMCETWPFCLQAEQTDLSLRHSSQLLKQEGMSFDTIWLTDAWSFKHIWQVCKVLAVSCIDLRISSPVTDLGR